MFIGSAKASVLCIACLTLAALSATAAPITVFSTGSPDGKIATLSRTASPGKLETETADDFILGAPTLISGGTFTGLLVGGATAANIQNIEIELYGVFPTASANPPSGQVLTRVNSPSDNNFAAFDSGLGQLSFVTMTLSSNFTASNSVVNGIHPIPNQFTGGEGAVSGAEVQITITFATPFLVGATDHVFFRPEVNLGNAGNFLWLSAPKPIVAGTPFNPDLQSWIRNDGPGTLAPDWERIGTDVTNQGPFNASFSLIGTSIPEPSTFVMFGAGLVAIAIRAKRRIA